MGKGGMGAVGEEPQGIPQTTICESRVSISATLAAAMRSCIFIQIYKQVPSNGDGRESETGDKNKTKNNKKIWQTYHEQGDWWDWDSATNRNPTFPLKKKTPIC